MRKGLKIESYDLNLKREGTPQRKQKWNGHMLTRENGEKTVFEKTETA